MKRTLIYKEHTPAIRPVEPPEFVLPWDGQDQSEVDRKAAKSSRSAASIDDSVHAFADQSTKLGGLSLLRRLTVSVLRPNGALSSTTDDRPPEPVRSLALRRCSDPPRHWRALASTPCHDRTRQS